MNWPERRRTLSIAIRSRVTAGPPWLFFPASVSGGGALAYPGQDAYIYGIGSTGNFAKYAFQIPYYYGGTFTSSIIDLGQNSTPTAFNFTVSTSSATNIKFQIRSSATLAGLASATYYGPTSTSDYYTSSGQVMNAIHNTSRYFQYQAIMSTTDNTQTPVLSDATINYIYYPASSALTSSAYNTSDPHNIMANVKWTASTSASTSIKFQIRSAPDAAGAPGTWSSFVGPDGTTATYFASSTGGDAMPSVLTSNSQWFQYKAYVTTVDGSVAPALLSDVQVKYVVNARPQFNPDYPSTGNGGVSATESATGTVFINYSVLDSDTNTGSITPGFVTPTFQYSLDGGSSWECRRDDLARRRRLHEQGRRDGNLHCIHRIVGPPASQIPGNYLTNAKIRVTINDNEAAKQYRVVDVGGVHARYQDAGARHAAGHHRRVEIAGGPRPFGHRRHRTADEDRKSVESFRVDLRSIHVDIDRYLQCRRHHLRAVQGRLRQRDCHSVGRAPGRAVEYFLSGYVGRRQHGLARILRVGRCRRPDQRLRQYNVYRSVNGGAYTFLTSGTNRQLNFNVDSGLSNTSTYSYKLNTQDSLGNVSLFSSATGVDTPDGVGSSNNAAPTITSVTGGAVTTTGATITWNTSNTLSNSTVYYIATTTYPGTDKSLYTRSVGSTVDGDGALGDALGA